MGAVTSCSGDGAFCQENREETTATSNEQGNPTDEEIGYPKRRKEVDDGSSSSVGLSWGVSCMQGWRDGMEDAHIVMPTLGMSPASPSSSSSCVPADAAGVSTGEKAASPKHLSKAEKRRAKRRQIWGKVSLFGVLDGHGGPQVARFVERHLPEAILEGDPGDITTTFKNAYLSMDDLLRTAGGIYEVMCLSNKANGARSLIGRLFVHPDNIGCTAVNCLIFPDKFVVANVGDSRAVLCRGGEAIELSEDHKPANPIEHQRIRDAGGWLEAEDYGSCIMYRVNGDLNLSRALGDLEYKRDTTIPAEAQIISGEPDVTIVERDPMDEFLIIACDGIWDVVTSQEAVDFVRPKLLSGTAKSISDVCSELLDHCLSPCLEETGGLGGDNMTAIIVRLAPPVSKALPVTSISTAQPMSAVVSSGLVPQAQAPSNRIIRRSLPYDSPEPAMGLSSSSSQTVVVRSISSPSVPSEALSPGVPQPPGNAPRVVQVIRSTPSIIRPVTMRVAQSTTVQVHQTPRKPTTVAAPSPPIRSASTPH